MLGGGPVPLTSAIPILQAEPGKVSKGLVGSGCESLEKVLISGVIVLHEGSDRQSAFNGRMLLPP